MRQQIRKQTRVHQTHTTTLSLLRATSSNGTVFLSLRPPLAQFYPPVGKMVRGKKVTRQQRSRQTRVHQTHTTTPFLLRATSSNGTVFLSLSLRSRQFLLSWFVWEDATYYGKMVTRVKRPVALNQFVLFSS